MAINFPNNPTVNQTHTVGDITWTWDGTTWKSSSPFTETSHDDVVVDGDFVSEGLLKRGSSAGTYSIVSDNSANWNTAHGWGNHASAGYLTSIGSITNHSDVSTTNLAASELLKWSGTQWINASIDSFTIDADTLDGNQPISFLRSDVATSKTNGNLSFSDDIRLVFGNDSDIQIYHESTSGGVNHIQASAGLTITGQLTAGGLTYPATNGTSGQVLTSDGAGNVTWTNATGGLTAESDTLATVTARGATTNESLTIGNTLYLNAQLHVNNSLRFDHQSGASTIGNVSGSGGVTFRCGQARSINFTNESGGVVFATIADSTGLTVKGLSYPTTIGAAGQVLTSDGAGNVTWTTVAGGGGGITAEADTLDTVTGRGNTTTNSITVGGITGSSLSTTGTITSTSSAVTAGASVSGYFTGTSLLHTGGLSVVRRSTGNLINVGYYFNSVTNTFIVDHNANATLSGSLTAASCRVPTLTIDAVGDNVGKLVISDQGSYSQLQFYDNTGNAKVALKGVANNLYIEGGAGIIRLHTHASFDVNGDVTLNNGGNGNTTIGGTLTAGGLTYPAINGTSGQVLTSDGTGNVTWTTVSGGGGGGASVTVSDTAPGSASAGDLWWESDTGRLKIYYQDTNSTQWVDASPVGVATTLANGGSTITTNNVTTGDAIDFGTNNGTATAVRWKIAADGKLLPEANDTYDIGSATNKVRDLYLGPTSLHIGSLDISENSGKLVLPAVEMTGHLIPDTNAQYDLGNAEYKIRHLFLSDNSIYTDSGVLRVAQHAAGAPGAATPTQVFTLAKIKEAVAASTTFAEFRTFIENLVDN